MRTPKLPSWLLYKHPEKFLHGGKVRVRFGLVVIALIILSNWLGHNFLVEPPAKWYSDFQLRRRDKIQERVTRIVHIDAEDHQRIFEGRSPLPGPALVQAACALASRGPAVVVVDLDTSSMNMFPEDFRLPQSSVPIIWAVDSSLEPSETGGLVRKADPVLGGSLTQQPLYGIATMPADFDGVVRYFRHSELIDGYPRPTLPFAAVHQYCRAERANCPNNQDDQEYQEAFDDTHPPAFKRDVRFQNIGLSEFLTDAPKEFPTSCPTLPPDPRFKDRIVILGGSYSRADLHETPWGTREGADLVAMAIEQVFDPTPLHGLAGYAKFTLEIALAFLIAAIHHWIRPIPATVFTLVLLPLGMVVSSELMFLFGDYEVGIVPFMVGMLIHQLVGSAERAEHLAHELEHASGGIG